MERKLLLFALFVLLIIAGCQREYSLENGLVASGSIRAVSGDCLPKKVAGVYKESTPLSVDNTVDVTVDVTAPGRYAISSNTLNGYSFSGTGTFASAGQFVVTLQGSGNPLAAGTDSFTVQFDSSVCVLPVTVISSNTPLAVYTLDSGGTPPNCASAVVQGNFEKNAPVDGSQFVDVKVDVTTAGTYSLGASGSGLSFSASGVFTTTGVQTVRLKASGTPTIQGPATITFVAPFVACSFELTVNGPAVYTIDCAASTVNGTYTESSPLDASNTITLPVTVTMPGYYKITTLARGMTFADSGTLTLRQQNITLKGAGAPNTWGTINLPVGTGSCYVPITVQATLGSKVWRFTVGGVLYEGPINSSSFISAGSLVTITVNGTSQIPVNSNSFQLVLSKHYFAPTFTFPADAWGTYVSSATLTQGRASLRLNNNAGSGFVADTASGNLTVNFVTDREGDFSGTVKDSSGANVTLTNGYFRF